MKQSTYAGILAALLFPLISWYLRGEGYLFAIYGSTPVVGVLFSVGFALTTAIVLRVMQRVALRVPSILKGFVIRLLGAVCVGFLSVAMIYAIMMFLLGGYAISVSKWWVIETQMPGFLAAFTSYWLVHLFVRPVTSK